MVNTNHETSVQRYPVFGDHNSSQTHWVDEIALPTFVQNLRTYPAWTFNAVLDPYSPLICMNAHPRALRASSTLCKLICNAAKGKASVKQIARCVSTTALWARHANRLDPPVFHFPSAERIGASKDESTLCTVPGSLIPV
jgi:hypothetical protein